ncbi:MAG: glucose-6-phosphate isomerase [Planctomycetes bacterium]|nr:glucose-6-phosphate isomerase [Planctomycetota bacterium]
MTLPAPATPSSTWNRFQSLLVTCPTLGLALDVSRMRFETSWLETMAGPITRAFDALDALEGGAIANPDEGRQVGHYWLRNPERAPEKARAAIEAAHQAVSTFARKVHRGEIRGERGEAFRDLVLVGIGGSALGPQFVDQALADLNDPLRAHFLDNTDPDGFDRVLGRLEARLDRTLVLVISKSGGTKETRNGMLEVAARYRSAGLCFEKHAVAVTSDGSELDRLAKAEGWLAIFPMWDWVGGRTSVLSAVGLLPAALQGFDIEALLTGAREMDRFTRRRDFQTNPASMLAAMWFHAGAGRGEKHMVVLPYRDRLELLGRYLQQLVMESLGKEKDLDGKVVHQGLSVFGNKGSTDQHAFVQQLRDGRNDFFATFVVARGDRRPERAEVEPGVTSGDYLFGFWLGTREALAEQGRESLTISVERVDERAIGALIALFERAVGLYAQLVHINAYHQPGVEAGKRAAGRVLAVLAQVQEALSDSDGRAYRADELAQEIGAPEQVEVVFHLLERLQANGAVERIPGPGPGEHRYRYIDGRERMHPAGTRC